MTIAAMPEYRRRFIPGGTFFFSVMIAERAGVSLIENLATLRDAYARMQAENPVETLAIVVLPDHLHAVWRLPRGDTNYSLRWRKLKARFSRSLYQGGFPVTRRQSHIKRGELAIWQRRYWEHAIRDQADLARHVAYCWSDPVRHGLAESPGDWAASSFHRDVRSGRLNPDWRAPEIAGTFGERSTIASGVA